MGNGLVRRSKPENQNDNWRKPREKPRKKQAAPSRSQVSPAPPEAASHNQWRQPKHKEVVTTTVDSASSSTTAGGSGGAQAFAHWPLNPAPKEGASSSLHMSGAEEEEDDDDCANLADAAAKVWEDLMEKREVTKDVGALFYLGELKDGVERAAKRVEVLRREQSAAVEKVEERERALTELCTKLEERLPAATGAAANWKLGDMALRRGKGLCELSVVHHEAYPPYYEVRMVISGSVVGTEAGNLLELPPSQKALMRRELKELETARARQSPLEQQLTQAQEELKRQHLALTEHVEKRLRDASASVPKPAAASAGPGPSLGGPPPGMPDLDSMKRWNAREGMQGESYPDMRGNREDIRVETTTSTPTGGHVAGSAEPQPAPAVVPEARAEVRSGPVGFPSLDELNRREEQEKPAPEVPKPRPAGPRPSQGEDASQRPYNLQQQRQQRQSQQQQQPQHAQQQQQQQQQHAQFAQPQFAQPQFAQPQYSQPQQPPQPQQPAPPPTDWVIYRTPEGAAYYHNERTNETAWQLPAGAHCREPGTAPAPAAAQEASVEEEDPFPELRRQEEQMRQQREQWAQWYAQYCQWYSQQGQQAPPSTGPAPGDGAQKQSAPHFGTEPGSSSEKPGMKLPPKGPAPPTLDAGFEDQATYAIKSSVLKEMEAMVAKGAPLQQRKKALRCLHLRWHPDKNPEKLEVAKQVFQFIEETRPWFLHDAEAAAS